MINFSFFKGKELVIVAENVPLAKGILPNIHIEGVSIKNKKLQINWILNVRRSVEQDTGLLTLLIYNEKCKSFHLLERVGMRKANTFSTPLADVFLETFNLIWIFMTNEEDIQCSLSLFLRG